MKQYSTQPESTRSDRHTLTFRTTKPKKTAKRAPPGGFSIGSLSHTHILTNKEPNFWCYRYNHEQLEKQKMIERLQKLKPHIQDIAQTFTDYQIKKMDVKPRRPFTLIDSTETTTRFDSHE